jgi:hypothetical protein
VNGTTIAGTGVFRILLACLRMPATVPILTDVVTSAPGVAGAQNPPTPPLPRPARVPAQHAARMPPAPVPRVTARSAARPYGALGALALGALAVGALAIGALTIHRLAVRRAHIGRLRIDDLDIRHVHFERADAP